MRVVVAGFRNVRVAVGLDRVLVRKDPDGFMTEDILQSLNRAVRIPEVGDPYAELSKARGVAELMDGDIVDFEDLPEAEDGKVYS